MPRFVQLGIQRLIMRQNRTIKFPRAPFEHLVADLLDFHVRSIAKTRGLEKIPYIAFWPDGYETAFCFTHDIEDRYGYERVAQLVDLEKRYGIKSTLNIVPEAYEWDRSFLFSLIEEGFEIGLHGLNHDKRLFRTRKIFDARCRRMETYAKELNAVGFRSPSLQRYYPWMEDLPGIYDSSYPDVELFSLFAGGCCHILPWFIGSNKKVELPVTMPQDHYLFNLRRESGIEMWSDKWGIIRKRRGLGCVIIHPDYMMTPKHRGKVEELIGLVTSDPKVWVTTATNIANWWIERSATELVEIKGKYSVKGSKRAKLKFLEIADAETR
jgi:peptidoglycan/xylan/chitin deacetylase (PgdA/CDA1 family)